MKKSPSRYEYARMRTAGFTLAETLVVLGLISIVSAILVISVVTAQNTTVLEGAQVATVHALEGARNRALSGAGEGGNHGVRITEDARILLFTGDAFDPDDVVRTIALPGSIEVDLDGDAVLDVVFRRMTGAPLGMTETREITLVDHVGNEAVVVITDRGRVEMK